MIENESPHQGPPFRFGERARSAGLFNFRQVNPLRSMILFTVGAGLGLCIAGYSLFTAKGTTTHAVPPENIALVNQRPILRSDFIAQVEAETGTDFGVTSPEQRLKVLNEMVREELFVQRGLELDFPSTDPDTRAALVAAVEQQVVADVTTAMPNDDQLRQYYRDNHTRYASEGEMELHNFLLSPSLPDDTGTARANQAAVALRNGTPIDEVEESYGLKEQIPEHAGAEQFYFAEKTHLGAALFGAALSLNDGDVSDPVSIDDGVHILQMVKNIKPVELSFDQARSQVQTDYIEDSKRRLEAIDEQYLRAKAEILVADDYRQAYLNQTQLPHGQ